MAERQRRQGWRAIQLRPLLGTTHAQILGYAQAHGLAWVEDESNRDPRYRRNALRHQAMPLLAEHFPGSGAALARAAALQADAAELLDDLARVDAASAIDAERLDCAALAALRVPRARNLLRYFIEQQGLPMPSARRLDEALHQLRDAARDARVRVGIGPADIRRFRGGAYLVPAVATPVEPVLWQGGSELRLPGFGVLRLQAVVGEGLKRSRLERSQVTLGLREGGERMRMASGGATRSLKNLLQEHAIAPWLRERLPVLKCDGELVWAAGVGCHADWLAAAGEPGLLPEWCPTQP
jgi:tRNA(Ile)-lysidine synthase